MSETIDRLERQNKELEQMIQMYEAVHGKMADRDKSIEMTQSPGFKKQQDELWRQIKEAKERGVQWKPFKKKDEND